MPTTGLYIVYWRIVHLSSWSAPIGSLFQTSFLCFDYTHSWDVFEYCFGFLCLISFIGLTPSRACEESGRINQAFYVPGEAGIVFDNIGGL